MLHIQSISILARGMRESAMAVNPKFAPSNTRLTSTGPRDATVREYLHLSIHQEGAMNRQFS